VLLLLVVAKTFSAVVLTVTGTFLLAGSLLLILLGGYPSPHYFFMGAVFVTLALLLFRWEPPAPRPVPQERRLD
jgi:glucose dehydrogenase